MATLSSFPITWITNSDELHQALETWQTQGEVSIDTEFRFETTYRPELALVQVATREQVWLIDPLTCLDLHALHVLLNSKQTLKFLHALGGDAAALGSRGLELKPPLLDTQIAAVFCGFRTGVSLGELAEVLLGFQLSKTETRSNWLRRPLSIAQVQYAAMDVEILAKLGERLRERLILRGRLSWSLEESEQAARAAQQEPSLEEAWRRFRAAQKLPPPAQQRAWALFAWREEVARSQNRARPFLLRDQTLLALARRGRVPEDPVRELPGFDPRRHTIWLDHWRAVLAGDPKFTVPPLPPPPPPPGPYRAFIESFVRERLRELARHLELPSAFLLSKIDREHLVQSDSLAEGIAKLSVWKQEVLKKELEAWCREG